MARIAALMIELPPTYRGSAVTKILQGKKVRGGEKYAAFGLLANNSRYKTSVLQNLVGSLYAFAETTQVLRPVDLEDSPDWIHHMEKTPLTADFVRLWEELTEQ